ARDEGFRVLEGCGVIGEREPAAVATGRGPLAEAEDEDDRERQDEQDQVPGRRREYQQGGQQPRTAPGTLARGSPRVDLARERRAGGSHLVRSGRSLATDARDELLPDLDPQRVSRHVGRALQL